MELKQKICNANSANDLFNDMYSYWIDKCRNNCLHRDDTLNSKQVESAFEFTITIIAMLIEWYYLLF